MGRDGVGVEAGERPDRDLLLVDALGVVADLLERRHLAELDVAPAGLLLRQRGPLRQLLDVHGASTLLDRPAPNTYRPYLRTYRTYESANVPHTVVVPRARPAMETAAVLALILGLTLASGYGDSRGFLYASEVWEDGRLAGGMVLRSAAGFTVGVVAYWLALRFVAQFGVVSTEVQTIAWFGVTIAGVAISSGEFANWWIGDQIAAGVVLAGIGWLLVHAGG